MDVEALVRPVVESSGLELVEVTFGREEGRKVLRVTVDREGGLDLDTIAQTSEKISRRLDLEGFEAGPYALEVSSPGIERPLRGADDFIRRIGETVKVKTTEPATHQGKLSAADDDGIVVEADGTQVRIAYADIKAARTVFEWGGGR
jgi:ribosome maturation factor RimP